MNFKHFYEEISDIQGHLDTMDDEQLARELQYYIRGDDKWRSLLLYGSLRIGKIGNSRVLAFYAGKTLEIIEMVDNIPGNDNKKPGTTEIPDESTELNSKKILDRLLISLAIIVLCLNEPTQRKVTEDIEHAIRKKLDDLGRRFIDELTLNDYLNILRYKLRHSDRTLKPLRTFFDDLVKNAGMKDIAIFKQPIGQINKYIERLIREVGYKLEKPDRIFSYAESMDHVSHLAETLFDRQQFKGKVSFERFKWDYKRDKFFDPLEFFWVTCMVGLFTFSQSFERTMAPGHAGENVRNEVTAPQKARKNTVITSLKRSSTGKIKEFIESCRITPGLIPIPAFK